MIILKIVGFLLVGILALIFLFLMLRVKLVFDFSTESEPKFYVGLLFFKFRINKPEKPKKQKKESRIFARIKKVLGIEKLSDSETFKEDTQETGISSTVTKVVTAASLIAGEAVWLLKRFKLHKLRLVAVCGGGDAADAAMEYGLVCSAVYPLAGYLDASLKTKKDAQDIRIYCDFENDASLQFYFHVSVRIIHVVRALWRNITIIETLNTEEAK